MKKVNFLTMAAVALMTGFASCSNDEGMDSGVDGKAATITVQVKSPAIDSRAVSTTAPAITDDATISNFTVFVFSGQTLQTRQNGSGTSPLVISSGITTAADAVYVVANAGAGTTAIPTTVNTKAKLEAWIGDLSTDASQESARWAAGISPAFTFNASNEASAPVTLKFVAARITVKILPMDDYVAPTLPNPKSLILQSVSVLNAGGATKLFSASLIPTLAERQAASFTGKPYYAGLDMTGMLDAPDNADYLTATFLKEDIFSNTKSQLESSYFYFYSFENNANAEEDYPVIVTVKGTYDGQAVYFPVHLANYQTFDSGTSGVIGTSGVVRGNSYDITIKLTGKASFDDGGTYPGETGGGDDPTKPNIDGKLTVSLSISNWTPQVLVKEF